MANKILNDNISVVRSGSGFNWNENNYLEKNNANEPVWSYNPSDGNIGGLVVTSEWTNAVLSPTDMTAADWGNSGAIVSMSEVGIDGNANTGCLATDNDTNGYNQLYYNFTVPDIDKIPHNIVAYVEKTSDTPSYITGFQFELSGSGGFGSVSAQAVSYDTKTGEEFQNNLNTDDGESHIEDAGRYWKIVLTVFGKGFGNTELGLQVIPIWADSTYTNIEREVTGSVVIGSVECYIDRNSTPPVPMIGDVAGESYTKEADDVSVDDLNTIGFNESEGTFSLTFYGRYTSASYGLLGFDDDANKRLLYVEGNDIKSYDGNSVIELTTGGYVSEGKEITVSIGMNDSELRWSVDGNTVGSSTYDGSYLNSSKLEIGRYGGNVYADTLIKKLSYYPKLISDSLLQGS